MVTAERRKALARALYERVFDAGDLGAADEILAPDCVSHGPGTPPLVGTEQIKRQAMVLRGAIPDLRSILEDQVAEGDRVVSRWIGTGTNTGEFRLPSGALPPTGRQISFGEIRIDRFEGETIVESWFIPDRFTLWQQLGLIPPPPGAPPAANN